MRSSIEFNSCFQRIITRIGLVQYKKNQDGSVAVEFALIAPIFLFMILAIFEVALAFHADLSVGSATENVGRLIRTGQADGMTNEEIADEICDGIILMPDCKNKLEFDITEFNDFNDISLPGTINNATATQELKDELASTGSSGNIVVLRSNYAWSVLAKLPIIGLADSSGKYNASSIAVFRRE